MSKKMTIYQEKNGGLSAKDVQVTKNEWRALQWMLKAKARDDESTRYRLDCILVSGGFWYATDEHRSHRLLAADLLEVTVEDGVYEVFKPHAQRLVLVPAPGALYPPIADHFAGVKNAPAYAEWPAGTKVGERPVTVAMVQRACFPERVLDPDYLSDVVSGIGVPYYLYLKIADSGLAYFEFGASSAIIMPMRIQSGLFEVERERAAA